MSDQYFMASVLPETAAQIVLEFSERRFVEQSFNAPPHITLISPFITRHEESILVASLGKGTKSLNQGKIVISKFDFFEHEKCPIAHLRLDSHRGNQYF